MDKWWFIGRGALAVSMIIVLGIITMVMLRGWYWEGMGLLIPAVIVFFLAR